MLARAKLAWWYLRTGRCPRCQPILHLLRAHTRQVHLAGQRYLRCDLPATPTPTQLLQEPSRERR